MKLIKNKKERFLGRMLILLIALMLTNQTLSISTTTLTTTTTTSVAFVGSTNDVSFSSTSSSRSRFLRNRLLFLTRRIPMKNFFHDHKLTTSYARYHLLHESFHPLQRTTTTARQTTIQDSGSEDDDDATNEYGTATSRTNESIVKTSKEQPIVVIGGGGKTGQIICKLLAEQNQYVQAMIRTERRNQYEDDEYISYYKGDVTKYEDIMNLLQPRKQKQQVKGTLPDKDDEKILPVVPPAVVWAATSSSGSDTTAFDVDCKGAYRVAKVCLELNIPKLIFISAGCVSRPNAPGSRAVNWLTQFSYGKDVSWISAKMAGETAIRDLYNNKSNNIKHGCRSSSYTIIRTAAPLVQHIQPKPVKDLVVLQGDVYSSAESLSRENLAKLAISILLNNNTTATDFCTLEIAPSYKLYKNEEGNMIDLLGLQSKHQITVDELDLPNELIHKDARDYQDLWKDNNNNNRHLLTDEELNKKYPSVVSNYRGDEDSILIRRLFRSGSTIANKEVA